MGENPHKDREIPTDRVWNCGPLLQLSGMVRVPGHGEGVLWRDCSCNSFRGRFGGFDSLIRLLLGVDVLQPLVTDVLLEWLPDYMSDDTDTM